MYTTDDPYRMRPRLNTQLKRLQYGVTWKSKSEKSKTHNKKIKVQLGMDYFRLYISPEFGSREPLRWTN